MDLVGGGQTETAMRQAFAVSKVFPTALRRPDRNKRALATKVSRVYTKGNAGVIRHKKMAYVTRDR